MREFIYYSKSARTTGNFRTDDLMKAGRMDIVCQIVIMSFFVSHASRNDVKLHLVFDGPPDSPKHLELFPGQNLAIDTENKIDISKKDVAGLIKKMLYRYRRPKSKLSPTLSKTDQNKEGRTEVAPGYYIEKKSIEKVVEGLLEEGKKVYLLDKRGEDVRDLKDKEMDDAVFILGDRDGIPKDKLKRLKKLGVEKISVGKQMYFASQTMTILQNEIDRREL